MTDLTHRTGKRFGPGAGEEKQVDLSPKEEFANDFLQAGVKGKINAG